jgi:glucosamine--fructose-6-phosphate aminotransferase (isomerizing)
MCGIVGYVGPKQAQDILVEGLKRLEYRGYDSAGIAVFEHGVLKVCRRKGKLVNLENALKETPLVGSLGIGHTRWATHGKPSDVNAHPHRVNDVVVVHNGIIENHSELRDGLAKNGHVFASETDTEIFAHLISDEVAAGKSLPDAVRAALSHVQGTYAIAVLAASDPGTIVGARLNAPLVVGLGDGENFVASDIPAILRYTRDMIFLHDGDVAVLTADKVVITDARGDVVLREKKRITWDERAAEKSGYDHFMLKEIMEQPRAIADTITGRISLERGVVELDDINFGKDTLDSLAGIRIVACGTSWHAGLVGKFLLEKYAGIPVEVDLASEFRYRDPLVDGRHLVIGVSQSGETADTLAALKEAQNKGSRILAVCNVIDSSIARMSDDVLYTHAGPEIGVASTKAFTTQITAFYLLALYFGQVRGRITPHELTRKLEGLLHLPQSMREVLDTMGGVVNIAKKYKGARDFLYLGRGINYPIALEGALKLKEISYIHAEGYPAGEMKHGPIALIDENLPVVVIATKGATYDKMFSNLEEVRARDGKVIAIATIGDERIRTASEDAVWLPDMGEELNPILASVPLQLLAYHIAVLRGTDVDQPRNLAKSVTVE